MDYELFPFTSLTDDELFIYMSAQWNLSLDIIDDMIYNPFNYHGNDNNNLPLNIDLFTPNCVFCNYSSYSVISYDPCINLLASSINSLPLHFDNFIHQCFDMCDRKFHILDSCETLLTDATCNLFSLDGYDS